MLTTMVTITAITRQVSVSKVTYGLLVTATQEALVEALVKELVIPN